MSFWIMYAIIAGVSVVLWISGKYAFKMFEKRAVIDFDADLSSPPTKATYVWYGVAVAALVVLSLITVI